MQIEITSVKCNECEYEVVSGLVVDAITMRLNIICPACESNVILIMGAPDEDDEEDDDESDI